jgi:hypothetical protein
MRSDGSKRKEEGGELKLKKRDNCEEREKRICRPSSLEELQGAAKP